MECVCIKTKASYKDLTASLRRKHSQRHICESRIERWGIVSEHGEKTRRGSRAGASTTAASESNQHKADQEEHAHRNRSVRLSTLTTTTDNVFGQVRFGLRLRLRRSLFQDTDTGLAGFVRLTLHGETGIVVTTRTQAGACVLAEFLSGDSTGIDNTLAIFADLTRATGLAITGVIDTLTRGCLVTVLARLTGRTNRDTTASGGATTLVVGTGFSITGVFGADTAKTEFTSLAKGFVFVTIGQFANTLKTNTFAGALIVHLTGQVSETFTRFAGHAGGAGHGCTGISQTGGFRFGVQAKTTIFTGIGVFGAFVVNTLASNTGFTRSTGLACTGIGDTFTGFADLGRFAEDATTNGSTGSIAAELVFATLNTNAFVIDTAAIDTKLALCTTSLTLTLGNGALTADTDELTGAVVVNVTFLRLLALTENADVLTSFALDSSTGIVNTGLCDGVTDATKTAGVGLVASLRFAKTFGADLSGRTSHIATEIRLTDTVYTDFSV